ncbi:putative outermembrane protein [hydrothermal vent metagenome]|uniref:Putative outermembrane protein n=1 Tax=hydrothermal vent metagenome TaxID=652676 RepID=A0A3B0WKY1_9ZZZZ
MRLEFKQYWLLFLLCFFYATNNAYAVLANDTTVQEPIRQAIKQAENLQLSQHETWLALLHYKRETVTRRFISQADDERFFLDKNGKTDSHAELLANINAFLQPPKKAHAQCLFPARWWWLKQQLALPNDYDVMCPRLDAFMEKFSHDKLFLVFPSMYLNNPGSSFGHTFLRFDAKGESVLSSQTLNYAAKINQDDNLVSYIGKGVFGGYKGFFRNRPYADTVEEYNNIEHRDIWEYQLDFTPDEIKQLVRHVWEMKGIDFDYYFLRENCAYRLLAMVDVMRPGMKLTGENDFPVYAIPVDTVRALDEKNLIQSRHLRPSLATEIDGYFNSENNENSTLVLALISDKVPADKKIINDHLQVLDSDAEKQQVLKKSYDILRFNGQQESLKAEKILQLINEFPLPLNVSKDSQKISPEKGHDSIRVAAGYGEQNSRQYIGLRFRPAFHDLLDAPQGYVNGAAINVLDTRLKWFTGNDSSSDFSSDAGNELRLESLRIFNMTSLNPMRRWHKPLSWLLDFRFDRAQLSDTKSAKNFTSRGGVGFSFRYYSLTPFALVVGEWQLASSYDKGYSLLLGLQVGLQYNFKSSKLMMSYESDAAVSGFDLNRSISLLQWQYNLQVNHAVRINYKRTEYDFYNDEDWSLNYNYYF